MNNPLLKTKLTGKEKSKLYDCIDKNGKLYISISEDDVCMINTDTDTRVVSFGALTPELMQDILRFCGIYCKVDNAT